MAEERTNVEIREAILAGERAVRSLKAAKEKLNSAKNWGIADILGGGLITNMVKHSKINDASSYIEEAKRDMKRFQKELKDLPDTLELGIDIGNFLFFADFFFDGLLADCMVQSKIAEARRRVDDAIRKVESVLFRLRTYEE